MGGRREERTKFEEQVTAEGERERENRNKEVMRAIETREKTEIECF